MNKKFSTLMTAGFLVAGALFTNVNAKTVTFTTDSIGDNSVLKIAAGDTLSFAKDVDLSDGKKYFIITTPNVTVLGKATTDATGKKTLTSLTGRIVVTAEGVTIKNLSFKNKSELGKGGYWLKTSVTAFADALTVDSCAFAATADAATLTNGIVLYPQTKDVAYSLNGNSFTTLAKTESSKDGAITWYSSAIQVYKNTVVENKADDPIKALIGTGEGKITAPAAYAKGSANPAVDGAEIVGNNTFKDCAADLVVRNGNELDESGYSVEYAHITKKTVALKAALDADMVAALVDAIQNSKAGTAIEVAGATAEEVAALLTDASKVSADVAKTFVGKNVVISTAKDDKALVLGTVDNAPEGAINIVVKTDGTTTAYVAEIPSENVGSGSYILMTADGKALKAKADGKAEKAAYTATTPELFVWDVRYDAASDKIRFYNAKTEMYLKADDGALIEQNATEKKTTPAITFAADVAGSKNASLGIYAAPVNALSAGELSSIFGASFYAGIEFATEDEDADKTLANNPFDGNLKPMQWKYYEQFDGVLATANANKTSFLLQKENGKLIVMQTTEKYAATGTNKYAYRLVEVDAKTVAASLKKGENTYAPYFSFNAPYNYEIGSGDPISNITVTTGGTTVYQLGSISLSDVNTLAAAEPSENSLDAITVELSKFNRLDAKDLMTGQFYTVTNKNTKARFDKEAILNFGKVLGLNADFEARFVKTAEALVGYPETQWAVTSDAKGNVLTFTNRENPNATSFRVTTSDLYKTDKENVYAFVNSASTGHDLLGNRDTIEIKAVATTAPSDGYKRYDADALKDQSFYLGSYSAVRGTAYATENHKENHQIGLEKEQDKATAWRVAPLMFQKVDAWGNPIKDTMTPDTICIVSKVGIINKKKAIDTQLDTLKIIAYSFKNIENDEYMQYDGDRDRYTTGDEDEKTGYDYGHQFALKIMGGDSTKYNLVEVPFSGYWGEEGIYVNTDNKPYTSLSYGLSSKVYAGETGAKGILNQYNMYQQNESDLFTVVEKDAPEYLKLKQGDVIKVYREEYDSESNVLFEKGEFLGMGNAVENTKINPALYVDTVYVNRQGNNRWEYLLGLNITRIDTTYKCDEPGHANLIHRADTTKGRFLVNFADSAIVEEGKTDIHVNKYVYETSGNTYAKLGFVNGLRTNDTLYINNGNTSKNDTIKVGTSAPQLVKFAFRIVDSSAESFVIETGFKVLSEDANTTRGYLRYINGYVVVTSDIKDAEVFKLKEDSRQPVANEGLETTEVSVIAGAGSVVVNNAAGKKVAISNILGQIIAQTVLTSDNETISVPAGIVVVSVDGEAAVKAIVK